MSVIYDISSKKINASYEEMPASHTLDKLNNKRRASSKCWVLGVGVVTALAHTMIFHAKA